MLRVYPLTLSAGTPKLVAGPAPSYYGRSTLVVTNTTAGDVFLGDAATNATKYGLKVPAGSSANINNAYPQDTFAGEQWYAFSTAGGTINVLERTS